MGRRVGVAGVTLAAAAAATLACLCAPRGVTAQAGMAGSLSAAGGQYVVTAVIPILEQKLAHIVVPGTSGKKDGFEYSLSDITCSGFKVGSGSLTLSPSTGVAVSLSGLSVSCSASWSFKLKVWPHLPKGSGSASVSVTSTSASLGLGVSASGSHPQLQPNNVALSIGSLNISFHGSLWDWLLDIFKGYIEKTVKSGITSAFSGAISNFIATDVNPALLAINLAIPLPFHAPYDIAEMRFGLSGNPTFTTTYVGVDLQGDIVPIANPVTPPITPPALPPFNAAAAASYLQMQLSSYTFESALHTYSSAGVLVWDVSPAKVPLGFNVTSAYAIVAPGLPTAYPGAPVGIHIDFAGRPSISITPAGVNATAPLLLSFMVTTPAGAVNAFTLAATTTMSARLRIGANADGALALMGSLTYLGAALSVANSTVGTVNSGLLQTLVDITFTGVVVPLVNDIFANGIPLPAMGGVVPQGTSLTFGNAYFTLASNFVINSTAFAASATPYAYDARVASPARSPTVVSSGTRTGTHRLRAPAA